MFPGVSIYEHAFMNPALNLTWGPLLMYTLFNLGDMSGKYLAGARKIYTIISITVVMLLRFGFFASFILIALKYECNYFLLSDTFDTIEMFAFGVLNGFITSALFVMGPELAKTPIE